jgi:hypothetical protein
VLLGHNEFPYQKNWKFDECHIAYWELIPYTKKVERSPPDKRQREGHK